MNKFTVIESSTIKLLYGNIIEAKRIIVQEYPFQRVVPKGRNYTDKEKMQQFVKDGFIDRYSGKKLINPGLLKVLSYYMPEEFPYHPHWKMDACHNAYWEFVPTVDHIVPVTLGGLRHTFLQNLNNFIMVQNFISAGHDQSTVCNAFNHIFSCSKF